MIRLAKKHPQKVLAWTPPEHQRMGSNRSRAKPKSCTVPKMENRTVYITILAPSFNME